MAQFYLFLLLTALGGGLFGAIGYFVYRCIRPMKKRRPEDIPLNTF